MGRIRILALLVLTGVVAANAQELRTVRKGRYLMAAECPDHCADDACVYKGTTGTFKCNSCVDGFVPSRGCDMCVCPPGEYPEQPDSTGNVQCVTCPQGFYCPGNTTELGTGKTDCRSFSDGLTTLNAGSVTINECINRAGFAYVKPNATSIYPSAMACGADSYSTGLDWSISCTPCVSGFRTNPAVSGLHTAPSTCKAPPGYYASGRNTVTKCPAGEYQPYYNLASSCLPCADGVTTLTSGSSNSSACNILKPGYAPVVQGLDPNAPLSGPITATRICPQKFYCPGGNVITALRPCPNGTWTKGLGSTTPAQCLVPPGYRQAGNTIVPCKTGADGEFKSGWDRATSCRSCGRAVYSDTTEWITVFNDDGTTSPLDVAGSSHSCYILPGMALTKYRNETSGRYDFKASICNSGADYGVSTTTYGLDIASCIPCPRNMVTKPGLGYGDSTWGYTDPAACVTQKGFGFNGVEGELCQRGYWSAGDDTSACIQCDYGRTTIAAGSTSSAACVVNAGYGLMSDNTVQQCPISTFSLGGTIDATCHDCPFNSRSRQPGADSPAKCVTCLAGYGTSWGATTVDNCTACPSGFFGPEDRERNACDQCLTTTFSFVYKGTLNPYTSKSVTARGASSKADCIAEYGQIVDRSWSLPASSGWVTAQGVTNVDACSAACSADALCQFITFDYATKICSLRKAVPSPPGYTKMVAFKTLPSGPVNETTARRRLLQDGTLLDHSSGMYTFWADAGADDIGTRQTFTSSVTLDSCMESCGAIIDCAGVSLTVSPDTGDYESCRLLRTSTPFNSSKRSLIRAVASKLHPPPASCFNNRQDANEDGLDCGDICQTVCPTMTSNTAATAAAAAAESASKPTKP